MFRAHLGFSHQGARSMQGVVLCRAHVRLPRRTVRKLLLKQDSLVDNLAYLSGRAHAP